MSDVFSMSGIAGLSFDSSFKFPVVLLLFLSVIFLQMDHSPDFFLQKIVLFFLSVKPNSNT